jgi:hypothetical protein
MIRSFASLFAAPLVLLFAGCNHTTSHSSVEQFPDGHYSDIVDYKSTSVSPFVFVCAGDLPVAQPISQRVVVGPPAMRGTAYPSPGPGSFSPAPRAQGTGGNGHWFFMPDGTYVFVPSAQAEKEQIGQTERNLGIKPHNL